ncbi:hypothetical protein [Corynebacterium tapiri]|uniref:Histone n=1 Tax=Corynebacterium tapiri TaxID=1448266 RepID=A0A5C4U348_9CORY|nr:hypothetical protein [Corynebacterium tapiri]TNL96081.1 hypothetical protein FHE74_08615 [Corynebacterium tapiri]
MPPKVHDTRPSAEEIEAIESETASNARRIVSTYAEDYFDAVTLMCMLGVEPTGLIHKKVAEEIAAEQAEAPAKKSTKKTTKKATKAAKKTTKKTTKKATKKSTKKTTKKAAKKTTKKSADSE